MDDKQEQFYYAVGKEKVKIDYRKLVNDIAENRLSRKTYIWKVGNSSWETAESIPSLMADVAASKKGRKRQKQIVFRLTDDEFTKVKERVSESGTTQAEFIRRALFNKKIINTEGARTLIPELKRIGNNLNQLAARANSGQSIDNSALQGIESEVGKIWLQLKQFL